MDEKLKVWDLGIGQAIRAHEGHAGRVNAIAVTADARFAVSASEDSTLKVWDLSTGQVLRTLEGRVNSMNVIAVTTDGRFAVSAEWGGGLTVWDLGTGRSLRTMIDHYPVIFTGRAPRTWARPRFLAGSGVTPDDSRRRGSTVVGEVHGLRGRGSAHVGP
jgi:WD40 repeat protein